MTKVPYFSSEKIADRSWMIRNSFCAATPALCYLIEGDDCAVLIDTMMGWGDLAGYCATLTDKPIRLVNTHAHGDHTGGNYQFDACWIGHRDIPYFMNGLGLSKEKACERAKARALPEYAPYVVPDEGDFSDAVPMKVYPLYDGDVLDLGGRTLEVVEVGGHTPGTIVLIDPGTRIAYTGDACNGNTLLQFPNSLPIVSYMKALLHFNEHRGDFDTMYGGHQIFDVTILDEAIESVARVIAGTDAKFETKGMGGQTVLYSEARVITPDGHGARADGKRFNMSYVPSKLTDREPEHRIIDL